MHAPSDLINGAVLAAIEDIQRNLRQKIIKRFWAKVDRRGPDECWEWRGVRNQKGYGKVRLSKRWYYTHRIACELAHGPLGTALACHKCDNPPCCNPAHLFAGTRSENTLDMYRKGRANRGGAFNGRSKLSDGQARAIRARAAQGETSNALAREFGLSTSSMLAVIHGGHWKHVGGPTTTPGLSPAVVNARKTHCDKGHPLSGGNVRVAVKPSGRERRGCRTCDRERMRAVRKRQRQTDAAAELAKPEGEV